MLLAVWDISFMAFMAPVYAQDTRKTDPSPFTLHPSSFILPVYAQDVQEMDTPDRPQPQISNPKSPTRAAVLSMLFPGLGEAYAGSWKRAGVFFAAEAATWAGFFAFRTYANWRETDYQLFAAEHAGITLGGQPSSYFRDVARFLSSDAFNRDQLLSRRDKAVLYTGPDAWEWDSVASRETYLEIRRSSRRADNRSLYVLGVAFAARLVSAIDARHVARHDPLRIDAGPSFNLVVPPDGSVWALARVRF